VWAKTGRPGFRELTLFCYVTSLEVSSHPRLIVSADGVLHRLHLEALRRFSGHVPLLRTKWSPIARQEVAAGPKPPILIEASRTLLALGAVDYEHSGFRPTTLMKVLWALLTELDEFRFTIDRLPEIRKA